MPAMSIVIYFVSFFKLQHIFIHLFYIFTSGKEDEADHGITWQLKILFIFILIWHSKLLIQLNEVSFMGSIPSVNFLCIQD